MRTKVLILCTLLGFLGSLTQMNAQSTAFTYQGSLSEEGSPANGLFEMSFGLFATDTGGTGVSTVTNAGVSVSNGLFTTTLDYGAAVFDGRDYWIEIGVQPDGGGGFTTLIPRQRLTATPYAIHAGTAAGVAANAVGGAQLAEDAASLRPF